MKGSEEIEDDVQKKLVIFCKYLEIHVEKWKTVLQDSGRTREALCNQADQLRHVEKVNLNDMEGFPQVKINLKCSILNGIEEEITSVKSIIEQLNKANQELQNKLTTFEKSTLDLNWEETSSLIKGGATQPPLARLLGDSLEFWLYFKRAFENINTSFKSMDLYCKKSMQKFDTSLNVNLAEKTVVNLLALTQYVDNASAIN